jgi:hypothetical protein
LVAIAALGLVAILGSTGGIDVEGCFPAPGPCPGTFPDEPTTPGVEPASATVQVGGAAHFSVGTPGLGVTSVQWYRAAPSGPFFPIAGATHGSYTLEGAQLTDNGVRFAAEVQGVFEGRNVDLFSTSAALAVSSMPGVIYQDTEFAPADWAAAADVSPSPSGQGYATSQLASGGSPGAWRLITIQLPAGPGLLSLFDAYQPDTYDPASQGPVMRIDFSLSCLKLAGTLGVDPRLLIEQGGRRFAASASVTCGEASWSSASLLPQSFVQADFFQVDGPACGAGELCPDFGAAGGPIRFGVYQENQGGTGFAGGSGGFGIDNWKVTVWRP